MDNPKNWKIMDRYELKNIDEIYPYSERINSYYARKMHALTEGHLDIYGAISMLKGIEYHFQNAKKYIEKNKKQLTTIFNNNIKLLNKCNIEYFSHELHAYTNRLGQFFYFCVSKFCQEKLGLNQEDIKNCEIPKIYTMIQVFRHKHAAHRCRDQPLDENQTFKDYLCISFDHPVVYSAEGNPIISFGDGEKIYRFDIMNEHDNIMKEAYTFLKEVIDKSH